MRYTLIPAVLGLLATGAAFSPTFAQGPACVLSHNGNPPFKYLWGGDLREVCAWQDPNNSSHQRAWVSEDGGRIRFFDSLAGSWVFQNVPTSTVLLDISFLKSGTGAGETGWAVGKGGVVLRTTDHGNTWTQIATEYEPLGDPGILWGVFFRSQNEGWLAGEHLLRHSTDGGVHWTASSTVISTGSCPLVQDDLEYYSLDFIEVGGSLRGICSAEPGVILTTSDGNVWSPARCDLGDDFEVWDVSFEPNPSSVGTARAYVCGGPSPNHNGEIYTTTDGGANWSFDAGVTNILYGIEALPSGGGVACGYGGAIFKRISGTWTDVSNYTPPLKFTAPLGGVDSDGNSTVWVVGSFGHLRKSTSGGASGTWADDIPYTQLRMNRLNSIHFFDDQTGWIAGQIQFIAKTTDGGCSFTVQHGGIGSGAPAYNITGLAFSSSMVGVAVGGSSILYTTDGGTNWNVPATLPTGTYSDVAWNGGSLFYAVGASGMVALSSDNGQHWTAAPQPSGTPNLNSIAFLTTTAGFAVGDVGGTGKAYRLQNATTTPSWVDVSPTFALTSRPLNGVGLRGVLPSVEVYAVGSQGVVLKWKRTLDKFETVPGVYEVDGSGNPTVQLTHENNLCVALPPTPATTIFVGTLNQDEFPSDEGKVLYFNGTSWSATKCQTTKGIQGFSFPQSALGYGVGHANTAQAKGNFGDSSIVLFKP